MNSNRYKYYDEAILDDGKLMVRHRFHFEADRKLSQSEIKGLVMEKAIQIWEEKRAIQS